MQSLGHHNYNRYADALAQQRKKSIIRRVLILVILVISFAASAGYFLFFTSYLRIQNLSFVGLKTIEQGDIESIVNSVFEIGSREVFKAVHIQEQKNILFFDADDLREKILAQFPVVESLEIRKEYPHKITFQFIERTPLGSWCFIDDCRYFDGQGVLWGRSLKSSGSLLLNVDDLRPSQPVARLESKLLDSILVALDSLSNLDIIAIRVKIDPESIGDFKIYTSGGYFIFINKDSDIKNQINVFRIFLEEKGKDFKPAEYLDLRIDVRVYYK